MISTLPTLNSKDNSNSIYNLSIIKPYSPLAAKVVLNSKMDDPILPPPVVTLPMNNSNFINKNGIKIVLSPRKLCKSPSKIFTKLIKRDSDSQVFTKSPSKITHQYETINNNKITNSNMLSFSSNSTTNMFNINTCRINNNNNINNSNNSINSPRLANSTLGTISFGLKSTTDDLFDYSSTSSISDTDSDNEEFNQHNHQHDPFEERDPFLEHYSMGALLGEGATCKVYQVTELKSGNKYAAKVLPTYKIFRKDFSLISKEIGIIRGQDHPNIIKMYDCLITSENVYIIMEMLRGVELFDELIARKTIPEQETRKLVMQILEALRYLHQKNIAHRDLKPENLKFHTETHSSTPILKVLDFGFARFLSSEENDLGISNNNNNILQPVGTLGYEAPEILLNQSQTLAVDMWALGVITYILLCGHPPFFSNEIDYEQDQSILDNSPFWILFNEDTPHLRNSILNSNFTFSSSAWESISYEAKDFISLLLKINPNERLTSKNALNHSWFNIEL